MKKKEVKEQNIAMPSELEQQIQAELAAGYQRIFAKPLPPILDSSTIEDLGIRTRDAQSKDSINGVGLRPLPGTGGRGRPRRYLLSDVVAHLSEKQSLSHA